MAEGPCDIYAKGGIPCVAAHSMTRALYASYAGPLYSVTKKPGTTVKDIPVTNAGGVADAAAHEAFCGSSECVVQRIYDQSPQGNHLRQRISGRNKTAAAWWTGEAWWTPRGTRSPSRAESRSSACGSTLGMALHPSKLTDFASLPP